jgi:hypothetical protein
MLENVQVKRLTDRSIGVAWALGKTIFEIDQFRDQVMEMKDNLSMVMD